jgi:hypothetical protein
VIFHQRIRSRSPAFFDIQGIHPNIRASAGSQQDLQNIWDYLRKEKFNNFGPWEGPHSTRCVKVN